MFNQIKAFARQHRLELFSIFLISFLALGIRLYRIDGYLTFLGDEGRDVRIVRNILKGDPAFIGPQTSIGNMYLGPLYYYMMAPFLWLSQLNPVGPAIMVALLGTITITFTWWVGRTWFSPLTGLIAALLFSLSPVAIIYSRSSWNPNPMPFFALLGIWSIWHVWNHKKFHWLPLAGIALAFALQMHYLGLLLIPTFGLFWLFSLISIWKNKSPQRLQFFRSTVYTILIFALLMSPLLLFDLKHDWMNYNAFKEFFTNRQTTINLNPANSDRFLIVFYKMVDDLILGTSHLYLSVSGIIFVSLSFFYLIRTSNHKKNYLLLFIWVLFAYLGLGVYKQHVYAHYFGFVLPAIYLLISYLITRLLEGNSYFRLLGLFFLCSLIIIYLNNSPLKFTPNNQLQRTEQAVDQIIRHSNGKEFNFALIAKQNYDESYRYFFENKSAQMFRGEDKITDQLFVICEDGDSCQPEGHSHYQIAIFGIAHVVDEWRLDHLRIYKLVHSETVSSR